MKALASVVATALVLVQAQPVSAQISAYQGEGGAPGPTVNSYELPCTGTETVLLIQDVVPWFAPTDQDPDGALVTELLNRGRSFCSISSSDIPFADLSNSNFKEVIVAGAQTQSFYDNLFPEGVIHSAISTWVQAGGILVANLTDCASGPGAGGTWATEQCESDASTSFRFVGGVKHVHSFVEDNDVVALSHNVPHPIIAGQFGGDHGGQITDDAPLNDLDDWGFASHGYFINLPTGTRVLLAQPDVTGDGQPEPVMIQYPHGNGWVIATQTTTEWRYVGNFGSLPQNFKLLANEIGFEEALAAFVRPMDTWGNFGLHFGDDWVTKAGKRLCETTPTCDPEHGPRPFQHVALDVNGGSRGKQVFAAADGQVVQCGPTPADGDFMVLDHGVIAGANVTTVYWHVVRNGSLCPSRAGNRAEVDAQDPITTVFALRTDGRDASHLHFGIRVRPFDLHSHRGALPPEGTPINPFTGLTECLPCLAVNKVPLPRYPAGFTDPEFFIPPRPGLTVSE